MKYKIIPTSLFKRELRKMQRRGLPLEDLDDVVAKLANDETLEEKHRDHPLLGKYLGYRECHIHSDQLLIYRKEADALVLVLSRTGTHSDLFKK